MGVRRAGGLLVSEMLVKHRAQHRAVGQEGCAPRAGHRVLVGAAASPSAPPAAAGPGTWH